MDKTTRYIEMCQKAEEIQDLWELQPWDYFYHPEEDQSRHYEEPTIEDHVWVVSDYPVDGGIYGPGYWPKQWKETSWYKDTVWLPRQDQLQDMLGIELPTELWLEDNYITGFSLWVTEASYENYPNPQNIHSSMEQLWLDYVMRNKFGKKWVKENWLEI